MEALTQREQKENCPLSHLENMNFFNFQKH